MAASPFSGSTAPHAWRITRAGRRSGDGLDVESHEHGFHTRLFELLNDRLFGLGRPGTVPIFSKRFYIGSLRLDPGLRVGVAMQIDNSHNSHLADEEARCQFDDALGGLIVLDSGQKLPLCSGHSDVVREPTSNLISGGMRKW